MHITMLEENITYIRSVILFTGREEEEESLYGDDLNKGRFEQTQTQKFLFGQRQEQQQMTQRRQSCTMNKYETGKSETLDNSRHRRVRASSKDSDRKG